MNYHELYDNELINLLFTQEDRLPREAVDEIIARGDSLVSGLADIVSKSYSWTKDLPEWWAVVHTSFILGAIGTKETVLPLLRALRYASEYDCDWVTTPLPSIFGKIGTDAVDGLKTIALDRTSDWFVRAHAIEGLAAITISHPESEEEIFRLIGSVFTDKQEERDTRNMAGNVLLDFKREEYKEALMAYGQEEDDLKKNDFFYPASFVKSDVIRAFSPEEMDLWHYTRNWLEFYNENEIRIRQERWEKEDMEQIKKETEDLGKLLHSGSPFVHNDSKTGRNEPCPCGSGKKYKKCCGMLH